MNDFVRQAIIVGSTAPPAYLVLKLIFKRSIMFTVSWNIVLYIFFVSYMTFVGSKLGGLNTLWITPFEFAVGAGVFVYINRILRKPLEKSISQVKALSEGHVDIHVERSESKSELGVLNNSLMLLVATFKGILNDINASADNLASASQQMSSSSQQLSQGANNQAGSIEEVSSTMEEISANIEQNTSNAMQTEQVAKEANQGIQVVAERSRKAVQSNKNIAEKITIINDIAFQTNMLALNAAVEAARAGEHGRGFAVVAAEVRRLAERSKLAAEEIVGLAQTSLELAEGAGEVMGETLPKIENTSRLVQEITAASSEQSNGAIQVNTALQQLSGITQQNAAASEQLATSARQLAAQADHLKEIMSFFRTGQQAPAKTETRPIGVTEKPHNGHARVKIAGTGLTLNGITEEKEFERF
ncbi:MAG: methyl-accepting chemotaxis protein [Bacteroidales bacterium]|nr:methyl-accepting chemotaxis protein [Bacteroidales bacterium]